MQTRAVHIRKRIAQLQHQGFLGLMHGKEALASQSQDHKDQNDQKQRIVTHISVSPQASDSE